MLRVYGYFLLNILNDDINSKIVIEKLMINKKRTETNKVDLESKRFGTNANTCVYSISGNWSQIGIVYNVNSKITELLGYD